MLDAEGGYQDWDSLNKRKLKVDPLTSLFLRSPYFVQCYIISEFEKSSSPYKLCANDVESALSTRWFKYDRD